MLNNVLPLIFSFSLDLLVQLDLGMQVEAIFWPVLWVWPEIWWSHVEGLKPPASWDVSPISSQAAQLLVGYYELWIQSELIIVLLKKELYSSELSVPFKIRMQVSYFNPAC